MERKKRLDPKILKLPLEKMRQGYYSDVYFNRAKEILEKDKCNTIVTMQVFQKNEAVLCGIDEAIAILKLCSGYAGGSKKWIKGWNKLKVKALYDGDKIKPYQTVMIIEGSYSLFAHLETDYLGVLARRTKVSTNTTAVVRAARSKPVMFFPARFDHHLVQTGDGYAAYISGALGVSTDAQGEWWGSKGLGTMPHGLIAAYGGDTVMATKKFAEFIPEEVKIISLVDFENNSPKTAVRVAQALGKKLWGVRLDTSSTIVDFSVINQMSTFNPTGVCSQLVRNVRIALDEAGFRWVKIVASGGFNPKKITEFERTNVPVDVYAVGSFLFEGNFDFTADVVRLKRGEEWIKCSKVGRIYRPNSTLEAVN